MEQKEPQEIIVGDIHGAFDELQELLMHVGYCDGDRLTPLGDIVDGGPKSPEVVQLLMNLNARPLMGNHEHDHLQQWKLPEEERCYSRTKWATIQQFKEANRKNKVAATYENAINYFKTFRRYRKLSNVLLVHAGVDYGRYRMDLDHPEHQPFIIGCGPSSKVGDLPEWTKHYPEDELHIMFGHRSISKELRRWKLPQRINLWPLDTRAAGGGWLTAVVLPSFKVYSVQTRQETRDYRSAYATACA